MRDPFWRLVTILSVIAAVVICMVLLRMWLIPSRPIVQVGPTPTPGVTVLPSATPTPVPRVPTLTSMPVPTEALPVLVLPAETPTATVTPVPPLILPAFTPTPKPPATMQQKG